MCYFIKESFTGFPKIASSPYMCNRLKVPPDPIWLSFRTQPLCKAREPLQNLFQLENWESSEVRMVCDVGMWP